MKINVNKDIQFVQIKIKCAFVEQYMNEFPQNDATPPKKKKKITGVIAMGGRMLSFPQEAAQVIACLFLYWEAFYYVPLGFFYEKICCLAHFVPGISQAFVSCVQKVHHLNKCPVEEMTKWEIHVVGKQAMLQIRKESINNVKI